MNKTLHSRQERGRDSLGGLVLGVARHSPEVVSEGL